MSSTILEVIYKGSDSGLSSMNRRVSGSFSDLSNAIKRGAVVGTAALLGFGTAVIAGGAKLIDLGSNAEETASLIQTSLGGATAGFNAELRTMATDMNRSFYVLQEGTGSLIAMTKAMGASEEQAADMGLGFAGMASDLGSFFNRADSDVLLDLQAALGGSSETLQKYGIIANETTLKQMALEQGLISTKTAALDPLIRAQLLQQAITEQASDAMGDAARTAGSWSNSMKGIKARLLDTAIVAGTKLIPAMTPMLNLVGDLASWALPILAGAFDSLIPYLDNASNFISGFVGWLRTGKTPIEAFTIAARGIIPQEIVSRMLDFKDNVLPDLVIKIYAIRDAVLSFITPIRQWVADNIILNDVLIGLAIVLGGVVLSAIAGVIAGIAPIVLIIGGIILAVSLLRQAWEADFLGIRTMITEWAIEHGGIMQGIKDWWLDLQITWMQLGVIIGVGADIIKTWWTNLQITWMQLSVLFGIGVTAIKAWWSKLQTSWKQTGAIILAGLLQVSVKWTAFKTTVSGLVSQLKTIWQSFGDKFSSVKDGIIGSLQPVIDLLLNLQSVLDGISLPAWMTPGSPTPWELGLKGVSSAMQVVYKQDLPMLTSQMQGMQAVSNRSQTINQQTTIYTSNVDTRGETNAAIQQFETGGI